jgi:polysaccharide export outer membrane protein
MFLNENTSWARAMLFFVLLLLASAQVSNAQGTAASSQSQNSTTNVAKAAQPPTADTVPQRVADVKPDSYVIGAEDTLSINVWKEPEMSKVVPVRPDGMISLPLIGDIKAAGYTPVQLQDNLANAMKKLISDPQVTVIVTEVRSLSFNVVGQVAKPGFFPLTRELTVLDAIALAGGFRDFAKTKKIYVLRKDANGKEERLPFNYKAVIKGQNADQNIELQPRDTVVVP